MPNPVELVFFYDCGVLRVLEREPEPGYRAPVPAPVLLRLLGRILRFAPGLSSTAAEEWQHELAELEGAILVVVSAVETPERRAEAARQLETAADRYRAFLKENVSAIESTGIASAAGRLSRVELDRALAAAGLLAGARDPLEPDALEQTWGDLAAAMALFRGLSAHWLPLNTALLPDRAASRLWWKQFLPVRRRAYVRHLQRIATAEVASERVGDSVGFRVRFDDRPASAAASFEEQLLDSPVEALRSLFGGRGRGSGQASGG
jgi:hypothetical protein